MNESRIEPILLTTRQAAQALSICERTLYALHQRGELPAIQIGRAVRYDINDIRAWVKKSKKFSESA